MAEQSNATSSQVRDLMNSLQGQTRQGLQAALDGVVAADGRRVRAGGRSPRVGSPSGSVPTRFAAVFAERAQAVAELRAAFDGFLGMQPVPPAGSPAAGHATTGTPTRRSLSATQATNRIAAAGALLSRAPTPSTARCGGRSPPLPATARLPASVWVTDPQVWQLGTVAAQVDLMATSPTLAATHDVVLRTVRLNPPALPTPPGVAASVSVLSPTDSSG